MFDYDSSKSSNPNNVFSNISVLKAKCSSIAQRAPIDVVHWSDEKDLFGFKKLRIGTEIVSPQSLHQVVMGCMDVLKSLLSKMLLTTPTGLKSYQWDFSAIHDQVSIRANGYSFLTESKNQSIFQNHKIHLLQKIFQKHTLRVIILTLVSIHFKH